MKVKILMSEDGHYAVLFIGFKKDCLGKFLVASAQSLESAWKDANLLEDCGFSKAESVGFTDIPESIQRIILKKTIELVSA